MTAQAEFELIVAALKDVPMDRDTDTGRRLYLAYLTARRGSGADSILERWIAELRDELSL
jgi:hypothetical protein